MKTYVQILLLFLATSLTTQGQAKPILFDELGKSNCETMALSIDYMEIQAAEHPDSRFVIVIQGNKDAIYSNLEYAEMVETSGTLRGFSTRLKIGHAPLGDEINMQFWRIPPGATDPDFKDTAWDLTIPRHAKAAWVSSGDYDDQDICPAVDKLEILRKLLVANPSSHTNVVLRGLTDKSYKNKRTAIIKKLLNKYGIPTNRIRFYRVPRSARNNGNWEPPEEYWFVP